MRVHAAVWEKTGVFFGWWVVFATAAIVFLTGGTFFYGFGALFNPIVDEYGWSRASVSFAFSLRSEVGGLAAPIVGFMVDRVGSRRLMMIGVALVALGFVLLSRMQSLPAFYGAVVVIALGISATGGPVGMVAITHWFKKRRGRALAMMTVGAGTSGVMVLVLELLISGFGWRSALLIMGVTQFVVCMPLAMSVRNRPEEIGLQADNEPWDNDDPAGATTGPASLAGQREGMTVAQAIRSTSFWRLSLAVMLTNLGTTAIIVHQIPFFTSSVGLSEGLAAASVTAMTFMSLVGRLTFGQMADFRDKRFVMAGAFALAAFSLLLFATVYEPWQVLYTLPVFALGFGGMIPTRPAFQAEYFGLRAFGAIQGLVFTIATLGALVGPVFAGWVYDQTDSYRLAFVLLAVASFLAVPMVLSIRRPEFTTQPIESQP
ncbi:MAG TPA: MFS transporter [Dehalococcoidia bacterium]|nr:MFS transporter [Dehalococcoidia bacterium]